MHAYVFLVHYQICLQVCYDDFDFRQYDKLTLQTLEETFTFPPRFVVNYKRTDPNAQLGSTIIVSNEDHKVKLQLDYVSDPVQGSYNYKN